MRRHQMKPITAQCYSNLWWLIPRFAIHTNENITLLSNEASAIRQPEHQRTQIALVRGTLLHQLRSEAIEKFFV